MPYKSDQQRKFMHARHPEIASRWDAEIRAKKKDKKVEKSLKSLWHSKPEENSRKTNVRIHSGAGAVGGAIGGAFLGRGSGKAARYIGAGSAAGALGGGMGGARLPHRGNPNKGKKVSKAEIFKAYARKDNHEPSSAAAKVGAAYGAAGGLYAGHRLGARTAGTTYGTVRHNKAFAASQIAGRYGRDAANSAQAKKLINNAVPGAKAAKGGGILGTAVGAAGGAAYAHHKEKERVGQVNTKAKAFNKKHGVNYVAKSFEVNTEIFKAAGSKKRKAAGTALALGGAGLAARGALGVSSGARTMRMGAQTSKLGATMGPRNAGNLRSIGRTTQKMGAKYAGMGAATFGAGVGLGAAGKKLYGKKNVNKALEKPKNTTSGTLKKIGGTAAVAGGGFMAARGARNLSAGTNAVNRGMGLQTSAMKVSGNPGLRTNMFHGGAKTIGAGMQQRRRGGAQLGGGLGLGLAGGTTFNSGKKNQFKR